MAEFPALPLWTDAYLGDTTHLTTLEHGAYMLLLMTAWRAKDQRLPDNDKLLARYAKLTPGQWARIKPIIADFFTISGGFWTQSRLTDEATAVRQHRERQSAAGKASALKRKGRHSTTVDERLNQTATPTPTPIPNEEPNGSSSRPASEPAGDTLKEQMDQVVEAWNRVALPLMLGRCNTLSPKRTASLRARLKDHGLEPILMAIAHVPKTKFLRGESGDWGGASFDFLLRPDSVLNILEGKYDDREKSPRDNRDGLTRYLDEELGIG